MALDSHSKREVRKTLLLELNSTFVKVSRHYTKHGSEAERGFLQELITSIKECVDGSMDTGQELC